MRIEVAFWKLCGLLATFDLVIEARVNVNTINRMNRYDMSKHHMLSNENDYRWFQKFRPHANDKRVIPTDLPFLIDDSTGVGLLFDGIGAISGGGATSKLLINYPEPQRSQVLDYLFKPGFGASLQILKVEIGGDSQSTDGSESSHMHESCDEDYNRGYEWWMMKEAKKRNPDIKLYGLPWTFPGWIGGGVSNPFINITATAHYILNWINGASRYHNLSIDYIGVWNERTCNAEYVKLLKLLLYKSGLGHIKIVVPDAMDWGFVDKLIADPAFLEAIDVIGQHYPGASSPQAARNLGKRLWASEDFSAYNDFAGGGCWARVMNEGPVNAALTSFIAWNLVTSYYYGLPYTSSSLMSANEPWSGHYEVNSPIWVTAHHTQFYAPGWYYLLPDHGVGNLTGNGTYIALTDPGRKQLTIVIETMDPRNAPCFYSMPKFTVADMQIASFSLAGSFASITYLNVWYSRFDFTGNGSLFFEHLSPISVINGQFQLALKRNEIYTLTTLLNGQKGDFGAVPASKPFPVPYFDDFESYEMGSEPFNFAQQSGSFEVTEDGKNKRMTQAVTQPPVDTCYIKMSRPPNLIGDFRWKNVRVEVDVFVGKDWSRRANGVFLASQVSDGGCDTAKAKGFHFWILFDSQMARLTGDQESTVVYNETRLPTSMYQSWFTMQLDVQNETVVARINNVVVLSAVVPNIPSNHGFVALGPNNFGLADFDNFNISRAEQYQGVILERRWSSKQRSYQQPTAGSNPTSGV